MKSTGIRKADAFNEGVRVTEYEDALAVLRTTAFRQVAHMEPAPSGALLDGSLVTLHGRVHLDRRRFENALFEPLALRRHEATTAEALAARLAAVERACEEGARFARVDLVPLAREILSCATASMIGLDVDDPDVLTRFVAYAVAFEDAIQDGDLKTDDFDEERWSRFDPGRIDEFWCELVEPSWARRKQLAQAHRAGDPEAAELPIDLLTHLALHAPEWERQDVLNEAILYVVASTGTSSLSVYESFVALSGWLERHPEDRALIGDAAFVRAACNEAIRIHPPPPGLIRVADADIELPSGLRVSEGDVVYVDLPAANHDPSWFSPGAVEYDPHRTTTDKARPYGVTFGAGSHMCIGQRLATGRVRDDADSDAVGLVPRIVMSLMQAGAELDPAHPPQMKDGTLRRVYVELPVRMERRALAAHLA